MLNQYSQSFARQICDDFFAKNNTATGAQLLQLTYIPQVNLFVISSLYEKWKAESEAFKSPFFNFEAPEVQQALQVFMNVVSQHISVNRETLEPYLVEATQNTLVLLLDPKQYFNHLLRDQPEFLVKVEVVKQLQKYTRINQFVPQIIAERMADRPTVFVNQAIDWAEEALKQNPDKIEPVEKWVSAFSAIVPLDVADIFKKNHRTAAPSAPDVANGQSFFDAVASVPVASAQQVEVAIEPAAPVENTAVVANVNSQILPAESLNDSLKNDTDSMADVMQKQAIANIAQSIPLGQKFMFIQQLFDSSNSAYDAAIQALDQAPDYPTALNLIRNFTTQNNWDTSSEAVVDLLDVVKRRFGK